MPKSGRRSIRASKRQPRPNDVSGGIITKLIQDLSHVSWERQCLAAAKGLLDRGWKSVKVDAGWMLTHPHLTTPEPLGPPVVSFSKAIAMEQDAWWRKFCEKACRAAHRDGGGMPAKRATSSSTSPHEQRRA